MHDDPFRFCPYCAAPLTQEPRFGELRPVCPACGYIHFVDPKVAVGVLVEGEEGVLLVRRVNEPLRGLWSLPAGFVNAHEDPQQAAERECWEETGLRVRVSGLVTVLAGREHRRGADIFIIYRAEVLGGTLTAGDDADSAAFFPRGGLPPLAFHATQHVLGLGSEDEGRPAPPEL